MADSSPSSMRAAVYASTAGGIENNLKIQDVPLPSKAASLPEGSVLVKTAYSSLNPVDYKVAESPASYFFANPKIPGLDFSGVAVESRVPHVKKGDRVFGQTIVPNFGALAEYLITAGAGIAVCPDGVKLEDAAAVGVTGLTAYQSVVPYIKSGDHILINGASGGVGTFAIQFAKALGAKVTAVCSGRNEGLCKSLGADEVIDYKTVDLVPYLTKKGVVFDFIFDAAFYNFDLYWQAQHYLKKDGLFYTVAGQASLYFARQVLSIFLLPGWLGGGQRKFKFGSLAANAAELETIAKWMKEGKVKPVLAEMLPFDEVARGYKDLKTSRTRGNIVIKI